MEKYDVAIIDGKNMFFKAFSVNKDLSVNLDGAEVFTGATFGFIQSLITIKKSYVKDGGKIIVAWDRGYKRRLEIYPDYKKSRRERKDEWTDYDEFKFPDQMTMLQGVLDKLGIAQAFKDGEEADDIVGTLSRVHRDRGSKVIIVSADKDFQQLIDHNIDLLAHKGKDNIRLWNEISWEEENGFHPSKFVYVLAMKGDDGDDIPGVQGIGDKGASKIIIEEFNLLEAMNASSDVTNLLPPKPSAALKKLVEQHEMFCLSYKLAIIDRYIKGIRIKKGKKDMEYIENYFEILQFEKFLKPNNMKILEGL